MEGYYGQLDLRSVCREGCGLSKEIDRKFAILFEHGSLPLHCIHKSADLMPCFMKILLMNISQLKLKRRTLS